MIEKQIKAMTRQWQDNDNKHDNKHDKKRQKTQVFGKFHFPGVSTSSVIFLVFMSCFCHVSLFSFMFS